jgi:Predicted nucleotide-binding protein containing TIR-like domain
MNMTQLRSSVFVGSSSEGLDIARNIQALLDNDCEVKLWNQGVFGLTSGTLESLVLALDEFDFAILVLTPDDLTLRRGQGHQSARDNVLFELGLFMGGLGRQRTFIVYDRTTDLKLPSDLAGVTAATFKPHTNGDLRAALGAPTTDILERVRKLGPRESARVRHLAEATQEIEYAGDQIQQLIRLLARSRKVELDVIATQFGPMISPDHLRQMRQDLEDLQKSLDEQSGAKGRRTSASTGRPASPTAR